MKISLQEAVEAGPEAVTDSQKFILRQGSGVERDWEVDRLEKNILIHSALTGHERMLMGESTVSSLSRQEVLSPTGGTSHLWNH